MQRGLLHFILPCAAVLMAPAAALAQNTVVMPAPPSREGTVGPEQLRDFALPGTARQAEPEPEPVAPASATRQEPAARPAPAPAAPATEPRRSVNTPVTAEEPARRSSEPATAPAARGSPSLEPPPAASSAGNATPSFTPTFTPLPAPVSGGSEPVSYAPPPVPSQASQLSWWPWLLAALVVAGAGGWFFRRQRENGRGGDLAFAGGVPSPAPAPPPVQPRPRPAPPAPVPSGTIRAFAGGSSLQPAQKLPPGPSGVVSSRLRPSVEIEMIAERAVLTEDEAIIHFEVAVVNSGSVPARNVAVEAMALNAGSGQDGDIAAFYGRPDPEGEGIEMVPPLGRVSLRNVVRMPRGAMREYVAEGRTLLVPIVAFNAAYRWSGGSGRSGAAFLVGRGEDGAEKMRPLRLDLGPKEFRPLTQRRLEPEVRR